jgi:hypothetical protein
MEKIKAMKVPGVLRAYPPTMVFPLSRGIRNIRILSSTFNHPKSSTGVKIAISILASFIILRYTNSSGETCYRCLRYFLQSVGIRCRSSACRPLCFGSPARVQEFLQVLQYPRGFFSVRSDGVEYKKRFR